MKSEHLELLACPACGARFRYDPSGPSDQGSGRLECMSGRHGYAVTNGIPRFVSPDNYAGSFGFQWRAFSRIQLDSRNATGFSEERFRAITGWTKEDLAGKRVLDAGCGAGRFAEVALKDQANLVACDLSGAVEVCSENLGPHRALVCQASIYELPFPDGLFDVVYCIGVVQHTPDPKGTVRALCRKVKPGGRIGLWIYERDWKSYLGTLGFKYLLRPVLSRLPRPLQFSICKALVSVFYPLAWLCKPLGILGKAVMRLLPIASGHLQTVRLNPPDFKSWVLLDTFDMYSPAYDLPQTYEAVVEILEDEKFQGIRRNPHGGLSITAIRRS